MNNKLFIYLSMLVTALFGVVVQAQAQTATVKTTLAVAVTSITANSIQVASTTGFLASTGTDEYDVYFDGELEKIVAINGTTVTIGRNGQQSTKATPHPVGSVVYFGHAGRTGPFILRDYFPGQACTANQYPVLPLINVVNGNIDTCTTSTLNGVAVATWFVLDDSPVQGAVHPITTVADLAYQALITDEFIVYTSITASRTVTLPDPRGFAGKTIIIKDGSGSVTGAIVISVTAGANVPPAGGKIDATGGNKVISTSVGALRLITDGVNWLSW